MESVCVCVCVCVCPKWRINMEGGWGPGNLWNGSAISYKSDGNTRDSVCVTRQRFVLNRN